jgi:hypothetical protein
MWYLLYLHERKKSESIKRSLREFIDEMGI